MSQQSAEIGKLAEALAKAQGQIIGAIKDSKNPFFKSNYADLASVWDACREPLSKNGLCVVQTTEHREQEGLCVITTLCHSSGQWIQGVLPAFPVKKDPQGVGSALTYSRRYALAAIVGIAQVDNDGEAAHGRRGGVHPEQPETNDGVPPSGAQPYRIPFGKYAKRGLEEIDINALRSYIDYLEREAEKKNKPIQGQVLEFVERATAHVAAFETAPVSDGPMFNEPGSEN